MREISLDEILGFEPRYRATFINSLGGFKSLALIGTKSKTGKTNLAIFNSFFHVGAHPPLFGFIIRPDSVERHTLENILETNFFTVNHVNENIFSQAHQTSARYPRETSEFSAVGLTEKYFSDFQAPFVQESNIQIGATFHQKIDLTANGTILIISKILIVRLPGNSLSNDGFVDINKSGSITCSGLDAYYSTQKLARFSYAKPDRQLEKLDGF